MGKYYGAIGFAQTLEIRPGVWTDQITERYYYGDMIRNTSQYQPASTLNDDIKISNQLSIVSDPFANENFYSMRYITYMGTKWKVTNVEVQYPRLILTIGGVYNE